MISGNCFPETYLETPELVFSEHQAETPRELLNIVLFSVSKPARERYLNRIFVKIAHEKSITSSDQGAST